MDRIDVAPDFKEFLNLLNDNGVKYLVVGGYAVAAHGCVRATGDLDIWIEASEANLQSTRQACAQLGLDEVKMGIELLAPDKILRIGMFPLRPRAIRDGGGR
jgi:hypothetical protein